MVNSEDNGVLISLIVAPWKFDVLKTSALFLVNYLEGHILVDGSLKFKAVFGPQMFLDLLLSVLNFFSD